MTLHVIISSPIWAPTRCQHSPDHRYMLYLISLAVILRGSLMPMSSVKMETQRLREVEFVQDVNPEVPPGGALLALSTIFTHPICSGRATGTPM